MKKLFFFFLTCCFLVVLLNNKKDHSPLSQETSPQVVKSKIAPSEGPSLAPKVERTPAQDQTLAPGKPKSSQPVYESKIKTTFAEKFDVDNSFQGLPRGYSLVPSVKSIRLEEYSPNLGPVVMEMGKTVFFKPQGQTEENWSNVVYDSRTKSLYPVSAVLKVLGANEEARQDLLGQGMQEYHYNQSLGLLYLQSSHAKVLSLSQDLKARGYKVELEVISAVHQAR